MLDRRRYPRVSVSCPVHLDVHLTGDELRVEGFRSSGTVLDISRGGLLAQVDRRVAVGAVCSLALVEAEGIVRPRAMTGRVSRAAVADTGWQVGIEFESVVELLAEPGSAGPTSLP